MRSIAPPTLALSTIVTHQSGRLDGWLTHHSEMGINEVFVFWLNGAPKQHKNNTRIKHYTLETALAAGKHRTWWLSWNSCRACCKPSPGRVKVSNVPGMCKRRLYMPEQALTFRYAAARATSAWIMALDIDETLRGDWVRYLRSLEAHSPLPGGVKVAQVQLVGTDECLLPRPNFLNEQKAMVRRTSVHPDERAFASIHEPTLAKGEYYVKASIDVLAVGHDRYHNWTARKQPPTIPRSLRCEVADIECRRVVGLWQQIRVHELRRWSEELKNRPRIFLTDCVPVPTRLAPSSRRR